MPFALPSLGALPLTARRLSATCTLGPVRSPGDISRSGGGIPKTVCQTSVWSSGISSRTSFLSRRKNVSSMSVFWALWSNRDSSPWTLPRCVQWWNGPLPLDVSCFSASWALPIFTDVLPCCSHVDYSKVAAPLTHLTSSLKSFQWSEGAEAAFSRLWAHGHPHIVDRFSKFTHFVPLPSLPPAAEMSALLVLYVFQLHSLLSDIVSDRGPQFTSRV